MVEALALRALLTSVPILARRLWLETPQVRATVPMLRGTWGAALYALDQTAYLTIFEGGDGPPHTRQPGYVLRPAPAHPTEWPALDFLLLGVAAIAHDEVCMRAWDRASGMGLDKARVPFRLKTVRPLEADGSAGLPNGPVRFWSLALAHWPLAGHPETAPCRIRFANPLRLLRQGKLIEQPALPDLIAAVCHRLRPRLDEDGQEELRELQPSLLSLARAIPARPWEGARLDLSRYSARQSRSLDLHGVAGHVDLPAGPGPLWPLLAAAQWLHLGKHPIVGLGQPLIEPL